ncbi:hypothetical protein BD324DRAFT_653188 [Kockovaella imperatae]|uniref:Uncharacterized protein n=1 Tax=Kockovaella imperatae TaxID=4999 RepID=A0A1Y1U8P6_9TREE|nr:hypothetical protein BD324DRAFT_653188 [Kockovaella imperatae]ORX34410.1 hypothetical protein BD324DRAFT_653188 [Kockovaella imperatae]
MSATISSARGASLSETTIHPSYLHTPLADFDTSSTPLPLDLDLANVSPCPLENCPLEGCSHTLSWQLDPSLSLPVEMRQDRFANAVLCRPRMIPDGQLGIYIDESFEFQAGIDDIFARLEEVKELEAKHPEQSNNEGEEVEPTAVAILASSQNTVQNEPLICCDIPEQTRQEHMYGTTSQPLPLTSMTPLGIELAAAHSLRLGSWLASSQPEVHAEMEVKLAQETAETVLNDEITASTARNRPTQESSPPSSPSPARGQRIDSSRSDQGPTRPISIPSAAQVFDAVDDAATSPESIADWMPQTPRGEEEDMVTSAIDDESVSADFKIQTESSPHFSSDLTRLIRPAIPVQALLNTSSPHTPLYDRSGSPGSKASRSHAAGEVDQAATPCVRRSSQAESPSPVKAPSTPDHKTRKVPRVATPYPCVSATPEVMEDPLAEPEVGKGDDVKVSLGSISAENGLILWNEVAETRFEESIGDSQGEGDTEMHITASKDEDMTEKGRLTDQEEREIKRERLDSLDREASLAKLRSSSQAEKKSKFKQKPALKPFAVSGTSKSANNHSPTGRARSGTSKNQSATLTAGKSRGRKRKRSTLKASSPGDYHPVDDLVEDGAEPCLRSPTPTAGPSKTNMLSRDPSVSALFEGVFTNRDAEGSPDPIAAMEPEITRPAILSDQFYHGPWERTRSSVSSRQIETPPMLRSFKRRRTATAQPSMKSEVTNLPQEEKSRDIPTIAAHQSGRAKTIASLRAFGTSGRAQVARDIVAHTRVGYTKDEASTYPL